MKLRNLKPSAFSEANSEVNVGVEDGVKDDDVNVLALLFHIIFNTLKMMKENQFEKDDITRFM